MATNRDTIDIEGLKRDLHGTSVGNAGSFVCGYCECDIPIGKPVCYEAIRLGALPNLKAVIETPDGWGLDAARCESCAIEAIEPATDGFDEVLLELAVTESNGVLSSDATDLTVLSYSPDGDGFYPAPVSLQTLIDTRDYGQARWLRLKYLLETPELVETLPQTFINHLANAPEVPPEFDL